MKNMTSLYKPITLILKFYYMSNGLTFEILNIISRNFYRCEDISCEMSYAKFLENWFRNDGEIDEKHALQIIVS